MSENMKRCLSKTVTHTHGHVHNFTLLRKKKKVALRIKNMLTRNEELAMRSWSVLCPGDCFMTQELGAIDGLAAWPSGLLLLFL